MLELRNLRKRFGSLTAVDGLSLALRPGEVFGLLGPNGAGKSTTISMMVGLLEPDEGSVVLHHDNREHSPQHPHVRAMLGLAPQSLAIYDELSALENLRFFASLYGIRGRDAITRAQNALALTGLSDRAHDRAKVFSGGMKRRLNLACALLHRPRLVLMDEPTAGVDPQSRNALFDIVRTLQADGVTVVYCTHYMEEAEKLCDRVAVVDRGRLLAIGTVHELINAHGGPSELVLEHDSAPGTLARSPVTDPIPELAAAIAKGGLRSATIQRPTLENVFLNLTGRSLRD